MSDPTDDPRPWLSEKFAAPRKEFSLSAYEDAYDLVEKDARELGEAHRDGPLPAKSHDHTEVYHAALDAAIGAAALLDEYQRVKSELDRLKSLESYQEQQKELEELRGRVESQRITLKRYHDTPDHKRVVDLESQLAIARKANHLEALQEAQKRIIELEEKLEERDG